MITIALLGAGNVATHLYHAFKNAKNVKITQWYSRSIENIQEYKNEVEVITNVNKLKPAAIYILAVSDDAIADLSTALPINNQLVVHTSGSVNIHDLNKKHRRGVFYPLQTFSKNTTVDFSTIPLCIEALEKEDLQLLKQLAAAIGSTFYKINTEQRQTLHVAAVFVNNFTNQLYRIAHEISDAKNIDFNILKPLILETAKKIEHLSPYQAQTGPAKRHDKKTLKRHLKLLENEHHKAIYELLTQSIQKTHYGNKKL